MNANVTLYNELVDQMLHNCFPDVWYQGIYSFLDMQDQLSLKLCVPNDGIHLGVRGIAKLVTYMKTCVFRREKYDIYKGLIVKVEGLLVEYRSQHLRPDLMIRPNYITS